MKRKRKDHRALFLFAGAFCAVVGIAWGAVNHPSARPMPTPVQASRVEASASPVAAMPVSPAHVPVAAPLADAHLDANGHVDMGAFPIVDPNRKVIVVNSGEMGMRIFRDPESGQIGVPPTPEALAAVAESDQNEDMNGLQQVTLPDGSVMVDLKGRFQESMVMQIDANGHRVESCVRDPKQALSKAPVAAAPQREDR